MEKENKTCNSTSNGACALGIATVPVQCWNETYDTKKALKQGTIFPELDLCFYLADGGEIFGQKSEGGKNLCR